MAPLSIDEISFLAPVDIGSVMTFRAEVVYVEGPIMRVTVLAERTDPRTGEAMEREHRRSGICQRPRMPCSSQVAPRGSGRLPTSSTSASYPEG